MKQLGKARTTVQDAVVLETGAWHVRLGTTPMHKEAVPEISRHLNAIARTRHGVRRQVLVGDQIEDECLDFGGLQLRLPIDRGMVVDWAAQKAVWDRALAQRFGKKDTSYDSFGALQGRTVIVTEPYFALPEQQRAFDMLLFDWYQADAVWRTIPAQLVPFADPRRPECVLVVDCGQSYTHTVPIVRDQVQWDGVKRLDVGGKVLTSLLKESFSYRQWNMMDETFLIDKMKPVSCFVASSANDTGARKPDDRPHGWSFARFVDYFHENQDNDMVQHYVLPDYAHPEDAKNPHTRFGYVEAGPGSRHQPPTTHGSEDEILDSFIAGQHRDPVPESSEHQILRVAQERFQLMELLFAPQRIGLEQGSLAELVAAAIDSVPPEYQDLMWGNVIVVGGTAGARGLRRRLAYELRMLAPTDVPVDVRIAADPVIAPTLGALALLQAPLDSANGKFLANRLVTRDQYARKGGSSMTPGDRAGSSVGDARYGDWNAAKST
ncbi:Actin- protein 6 [Malassezia psittaci]|uniref:Actin- protein 6 n=1 Tax=Malassezia psittaci TaxID=1821823 RepID=A0AAF0JKR6_9BASI|nr:Actin- protein 6 [Malassezia psittaci]